MKRKIVAFLFAIIFCLASVAMPCLAAAVGEEEHIHTHSDCGIEGCNIEVEHDHSGEEPGSGDDGKSSGEDVPQETLKIQLGPSNIAGEVSFSSDKKEVDILFYFIDTDLYANYINVRIIYDANVLEFKSMSKNIFGKEATLTPSSSGEMNVVISSVTNDIYMNGPALEIKFTVKDQSAHGMVFLNGTARGVKKIGSAEAQADYEISTKADAYACDHTYTHIVESAASCSKTGYRRVVCNACGKIISEETISAAHTFPATPTKYSPAPTCDTAGVAEYVCIKCMKVEKRSVPALGHDFVKEATVREEDGLWHELCVRCGRSRTSPIQCEHGYADYELLVVTLPATCTTDGYGSFGCTKCGKDANGAYKKTAVITIKAAHDYKFVRNTLDPTKDQDGKALYKCSVCGAEEERAIPKLSSHTHVWDRANGVIIKAATCKDEGTIQYKCKGEGCNEVLTETLPKTNVHKFGEWTGTNATCLSSGLRTRTCTVCGAKEEETVPALGHDLGGWTTVTAASCANDGLEKRSCTRCDYSETRVISKSTVDCVYLDSDYKITKTPTCSEKGIETCICSVCKKTTKTRELPINPEAHSFGAWMTTTESTCIAEGESKRACSLCGKIESQPIPATGHNFEVVPSKKGTIVKECSHCHMQNSVTESKKGNTLAVSSDRFTLSFGNNVSTDKDIFFLFKLMTNEEFNEKVKPFVDQINASASLAAQYGTVEFAYNYTMTIDGAQANLTSGTVFTIDLGDEYAKTLFNIAYIDENGALKLISPDYISRKGSVITVTIGSGTFKYPSNSLILLNAGAKKANYALPIIIVVLTLVIAAGAVAFIVLKNKKNDEHMHDTSI